MFTRKRTYGGQYKVNKGRYEVAQRKKKSWKKGSGVSTTGAFQTFKLREELGTYFSNHTASIGALGTDPCFYLLNGLVAGTSYNARHSPQVLNKSLEMNFTIFPGATQTAYRAVRCILLYDKQANGAIPPATSIINTDTVWGFIEPGFTDRFTVLYNEIIDVGPIALTEKPTSRNIYRKLSLQTSYDGEAATIADIETGALHFMIFGSVALDSTTQPSFAMSAKLRFVK